MNEQDEAIVRRFALQEEDFIAVDNTIKANEWGASKEQIYEFQTAFDIVGEGAKQLNEQQVNDLFLAIGYTMQDTELEILFQKCVRGEGGTFTYEVLLEAYNGWKEEQLDEKYIGAIFSMLSEKGKVLPVFPIEYVKKGLPTKAMKMNKAALKSIMGQVMYQDNTSTLISDSDVLGLVDEVACSAKGTENPKDPYITWVDFANLFKK